jgi:hypothetical protein
MWQFCSFAHREKSAFQLDLPAARPVLWGPSAGGEELEHHHAPRSIARIRLLEGAGGNLSVLEVETSTRQRILSRVRRALYTLRLRGRSIQSQRFGDQIVFWIPFSAWSGAPVPETRREELEHEVCSLLHASLLPRAPLQRTRPRMVSVSVAT